MTERSNVFESATKLIALDQYDFQSLEVEGTIFHVFARKNGGVGMTSLETSLRRMWPRFRKHFSTLPREAAIIDFDAPIGGGLLGSFIVGVFYSNSVSEEHQKVIQESAGWQPQKSTSDYIANNYSSFPDPRKAYVDDILVHEFGHLLFGWGETQVNESNPNDWWFSFGMGLLYDRIAWSEIYDLPSPLFENVISKWSKDFSKRRDIDQKLVNPDVSADKSAGLQRLQTYGHGKAYVFLRSVREKVGSKVFDETMNRFISGGQLSSYDLFIEKFTNSDRNKVSAKEMEFQVR